MSDIRIKILHFFRKNAKVVFIVVSIWAIVFFINRYLRNHQAPVELQTTYTPHRAVIDTQSAVPEQVSNNVEEMLDKYVNYLLEGNVQNSYDMLSDECKEYSFENNIDKFTAYAMNKIGNAKRYAIQNYSNEKNTYIYQVKYTEDFLETGITNTIYTYSEEKIVFKKQKDGSLKMAVGSFVDYEEINNVFENEYLKVDVQLVQKYYGYEEYVVKITNRSDYTVVILDNMSENEIFIELSSKDIRKVANVEELVLKPGNNITQHFQFEKFYDNNDDAVSLNFGSVRIMETYSGTNEVSDEVIQSEIQNAVAKFSVNIPLNDKQQNQKSIIFSK